MRSPGLQARGDGREEQQQESAPLALRDLEGRLVLSAGQGLVRCGLGCQGKCQGSQKSGGDAPAGTRPSLNKPASREPHRPGSRKQASDSRPFVRSGSTASRSSRNPEPASTRQASDGAPPVRTGSTASRQPASHRAVSGSTASREPAIELRRGPPANAGRWPPEVAGAPAATHVAT